MTAASVIAAVPARPATLCERPLVGVAAVLVGAFIATINTRISTVGLADIRGGLGLGFDEGSWLTSSFSAAQMVAAPAAAWFSTVLGARHLLSWCCVVFAASSLLLPLAGDFETVIALQLVRGLSVGAFIPAALGFILRALPPRWWIWGVAAYAFRFVFSQNIASAIEASYSESGIWPWIFWQNVPAAAVMLALILFGMPRQKIDRTLLQRTDWGGIVFCGLGFGLLYAGLDQGNRLDWLGSGTVTGLLVAGGLLLVAFIVNETYSADPLVHWPALSQPNVWIPAVLIAVYGFGVTATAFVLPDYLTRVQGLRSLQIGDVVNWIALPQFIIVPLVALLLREIDGRLLLAVGFALIALGSWLDTGLTHDWASGDFLPSQIVEAVGLALGITALVIFAVANIKPAQAAAIAVIVQTARLFGNEIGNAFVQTFVRVREQVHSNLVGLRVDVGSEIVQRQLDASSAIFGDRPVGLGDPTAQGVGSLGSLVQREAYVLAYIDAFWLIAWVLAAGLLLILFLRQAPPNQMTPPRHL
jgi:MFS transporter, DHA2 family, multidrug resistance protein